MPHIQEPYKGLLCSQEQGPCPQQTRPLPQVEREACLNTIVAENPVIPVYRDGFHID